MSNLQNYIKKAAKEYAFEIALDQKTSASVLEKKLVDFGVSTLVEKPDGKAGEFQVVLRYPITGQDLMSRICEDINGTVTVIDETGQTYSNKPLPKAEPAPVVESETKKKQPVVEVLAKPSSVMMEALDATKIVKSLTESIAAQQNSYSEQLQKSLEALRNELQEEKAATVRQQQFSELKTSATISAINENIANLQAVLVNISNEMGKLNSMVAESLKTYNDKITELAEASNKINHKVIKEVKRDDRGYITEVTEKIITEK